MNGLLFQSSMEMQCTACKDMKPFVQRHIRHFLRGFPLYWPGRLKGMCKECGVADYTERTGLEWSDGAKWEAVISMLNTFENADDLGEEE